MRVRRRFGGVVLGAALALLLGGAGQIRADMISPPTFVVSSINDPHVFIIPAAQVTERVSFSGTARQAGGIATIPEAGTFITPGTVSVNGGFSDISTVNTYRMQGTPLALDARVLNHASTTGAEGAFVNTGVGVVQWYVLQGSGVGPVNLRADFLFQGTLTGSGLANPRAFFNGTVALTHLGATTATVPLALDAHLVAPGDSTDFSSNAHTVPTIVSGSDISINEIIRSNPFQVTVGVPFGISFGLGAAATTDTGGVGTTTADSNFFDPRLATLSQFPMLPQLTPDGFGIDAGGGAVVPLASAGLTLQPLEVAVPEPASLTLLGLGALGLLGYRWRRRRQAA